MAKRFILKTATACLVASSVLPVADVALAEEQSPQHCEAAALDYVVADLVPDSSDVSESSDI